MIVGALYVLSFIVGMFVMWYLGKREYYDEEKIIDLGIFSTVVALFAARISFFVTSDGRNELEAIQDMPNLLFGAIRFLQLNAGTVWWVGIIAFLVMVFYLLWQWKWPMWPMLGVSLTGLFTTAAFKEISTAYWHGFSYWGSVFVVSILCTGILIWILRFNGSEKLYSWKMVVVSKLKRSEESEAKKEISKVKEEMKTMNDDSSEDMTM